MGHFGSGEQEAGLHLGGHHLSCRTGRAALACDDLDPSLLVHPYGRQVCRSLHESRNVLAHSLDSVRAGEERCDQPPCDIALDRLLGASVRLAAEAQIWIRPEIFIPQILAERGESRDCGVRIRNGDDCLALPRYRVRLVAAFQHNKLKSISHF